MNPSYTISTIALFLLVVAVSAAPTTDVPAGQDVTTTKAPATTQTPSPVPPTTAIPKEAHNETNHIDSHADAQDGHVKTSFTCYGRPGGYYSDVELGCKVYHYCMLGEYNGEAVYQRITYLCLKDTVFDQVAMDCVEVDKLSKPCREFANQPPPTHNTTTTATASQPTTTTPAPAS